MERKKKKEKEKKRSYDKEDVWRKRKRKKKKENNKMDQKEIFFAEKKNQKKNQKNQKKKKKKEKKFISQNTSHIPRQLITQSSFVSLFFLLIHRQVFLVSFVPLEFGFEIFSCFRERDEGRKEEGIEK